MFYPHSAPGRNSVQFTLFSGPKKEEESGGPLSRRRVDVSALDARLKSRGGRKDRNDQRGRREAGRAHE